MSINNVEESVTRAGASHAWGQSSGAIATVGHVSGGKTRANWI